MNNVRIEVNQNQVWNEKAPICTRDQRIKKVAYTILCLMNLAGIIGLLTYITMHYPIPSIEGAYFLTPFIGGVIAALLLLKIPTYGVNHMTYKNLTNLPLIISECLALLFFGPTVVMKNYLDWNDYADPYEAARIKREIETLPFEEALSKYGPRVSNLERYGYITLQQATEFQALYQTYKTDLKAYEILVRKNPEIKENRHLPQVLEARLTAGRTAWNDFKGGLALPRPDPVEPKVTCCDWLPSFYFVQSEDENSQVGHRP
jgi:hypothetical protein